MKGWVDGLLYSLGQVRNEAASVVLNRVVQPFALLRAKLLKQTHNAKKYFNQQLRFKK